MGGPEGVFALERVEHEMGRVLGPEGATPEEPEPGKAFVLEPKADESGEYSSDNESEPELDQGGQSGAPFRPPYENCMTRLPAPFNPSRRVAREGRRALWTSIVCHRSRPRSARDVNYLPPEPTTIRKAHHGMAKLAARAEKRNGRVTRVPG